VNANLPNVWREVSAIAPVAPAEIQVWRVNLIPPPAEISRLEKFLTPDEIKLAAQFHFAHDQRRFVVRRAVLRQLLAANLGLRPEQIQIESAHFQKPQIAAVQNANNLRFNGSHSADWALIALTQSREVGVDVEQRRHLPDAGELAKNYFSDCEIAEWNSLPEAARGEGFFNGWTRKEAYVKAIGLGLAYPLNQFSVSLSPGQPAVLRAVANDSTALERWSLLDLTVAAGYSAALVLENRPAAVNYLQWRSGL
jgi:4'-phosphopantetheinyl transferase